MANKEENPLGMTTQENGRVPILKIRRRGVQSLYSGALYERMTATKIFLLETEPPAEIIDVFCFDS
jgi:hypothetical protein